MRNSLKNQDLLEQWAKIVDEYEKVTKQALGSAAPSTPQDLEARCDEFSRSDRNDLVKTAASSVFKVAKLAVEASAIFSPATYVFTALTFLGDTMAHYRSTFTHNVVLDQLNDVGTYLGRMEGYLKLAEQGIELDARLKDIILTIFVITLRLCKTYIKIVQDSKHVTGVTKNVLKSAIGWDNGIASRLKEIKEVSDRELNHNVAALRVSDIYANDSKTRKANAERLKTYLAIGEGREKNWAGRQAGLEEDHIQGMGDWLFQLPEFKSWADTEHHTEAPVLYVKAASGYGKSYLCAQAIRFLKNQTKTQQQQQKKKPFPVSWYFFPEWKADQQKGGAGMVNGRMNKRGKRENMRLLEALRAVVWQLAEADGAFQNFVVKAIEKNPQGMARPDEVWTVLLNGYANASKQDTGIPEKVLFLVLDGYGGMDLQKTPEGKTLTKIIQDVTQSFQHRTQFRVLLSGDQDFSGLDVQNISEIGLSRDHQRQDAKIFIEAFLKASTCEHLDHESEEHCTLLGICKDLSLNFEGDYHELKECLQEVERSSQRGLLNLQELQGTNLKQQQLIIIKRKLETLNNELESDDIEVLNELIVCMVHWKDLPTVPELNAYLTHRLGNKFKPPIEPQLNDKFMRLACVENGFVYAEKLREFFNQTDVKLNIASKAIEDKICDHHKHRSGDDNMLVSTCMVGLVLAQLPPDGGVRSERLKEWVKQHTIARPIVGFDRKTASLSTIKVFLQSICDNAERERVECKHFFSYVALFLPSHFSDVSNEEIKSLEEEEQQSLGTLLYRVFMDEKVVETWLLKGAVDEFLWKNWQMDVEKVVKWLQVDNVRKGFRNPAIQHPKGPSPNAGRHSGGSAAAAGTLERNSTEAPTETEPRMNTEHKYDAVGTVNKSNETEGNGMEITRSVDTEEADDENIKVEGVVDGDGSQASDATSDSDYTDALAVLPDDNDYDTKVVEATSEPECPPVDLSELLHVPMKVVASQWFQEGKWGAGDTLVFLIRLLITTYRWKYLFRKPAITQKEECLYNALYQGLDTEELELARNISFQVEERPRQGDPGPYTLVLNVRIPDAANVAEELAPHLLEILRHRDHVQSDEVTKPTEPTFRDFDYEIKKCDAVEAAEKWALSILDITEAQSQRNTTHALRLAETFMAICGEAGFDEAERRCEQVKARETLNIKAQLSLIRALDGSRNRKRQALEELMKIRHNIQIASYKEAHEETWTAELDRFWLLCESTNSAKEAFTACQHLSEEFPGESFPLNRAQEWIERQKKLDSSFEIISMTRPRDGCSLLSELFCSNAQSEKFHQKFYAAATERPGLVLETYKNAIGASKLRLDTEFLRYHYGVAFSRCGRLRDAVDVWEKSMDQLQDSKTWIDSQPNISKLMNQVAEALGSAYLRVLLKNKCSDSPLGPVHVGTVLNRKRSESPKSYIEKLELYKRCIETQSPNGVNYLALLLAHAYLHIGQQQKAVASVEKHMSTAFSLLEDDTEDNDWNGYFMLAEALNLLGDDDNARAAWSLIVNVPDPVRLCELSITCSGGCGWVWQGDGDLNYDMYICRICPHVRFEVNCREMLSKNGLKQHVCDANHRFLKVPRRKQSEVRALAHNKVLVGKIEIKVDDWLDGLRRRYGIHNSQLEWPSRTAETLQIAGWKMRRQAETLTKGTLIQVKKVLPVRK